MSSIAISLIALGALIVAWLTPDNAVAFMIATLAGVLFFITIIRSLNE